MGNVLDTLKVEEKCIFYFLLSNYHSSNIIIPYKEGSAAGFCQGFLVLYEVDEHIGGAIQGGQEVGQVGQVLLVWE